MNIEHNFQSGSDTAVDAIRRKFGPLEPAEAKHAVISGMKRPEPVCLITDVVVAGGGMSGVCAAVAAARNGAKVVLVQNRSRLGGNASSEVRMHIVGANWHKNRPGWREGGLLEEFRLDDAVNNPQRCREMWDLLLYDKVIAEPNITLLLDSDLVGASVDGGKISEVLVRCDANEMFYRIKAGIFCDCTGDARLALEAGAELRFGREAASEFGESLAPDRADTEMLGSTILFTARKHAQPMPYTPPSWARRIDRVALKRRTIKHWDYGYWWLEWGGHLDTIGAGQRIRHELLSIVTGVWDHIKNSGEHPDSACWALEWVGMLPGKRESRRIVGDHILTQQDLIDGGNFDDAVAIGGWPMDDHPPGGFDSTDASPGKQVATRDVFNIPLRSLYSRNIKNLMMAGRNISASHVAFTSTRVMGTCSVMGQAVGTAAALCVRRGVLPRGLYEQKKLLGELQQVLLRDDQTIKGGRNLDDRDVARLAAVSASAEVPGAEAVKVVNGFSRDLPGFTARDLPEQDVPLEVCGSVEGIEKCINHWAAPMTDAGAWLELRWPKPQKVCEIQITFDTGFQRELTLTSSDFINTGIIRSAQPETVRDYTVSVQRVGEDTFSTLYSVAGNHQRVNRRRIEPMEIRALLLQVTATNGSTTARVFEVRCLT